MDKAPGKGTGPYADKGDEKSQEDRLSAIEARLDAIESELGMGTPSDGGTEVTPEDGGS